MFSFGLDKNRIKNQYQLQKSNSNSKINIKNQYQKSNSKIKSQIQKSIKINLVPLCLCGNF